MDEHYPLPPAAQERRDAERNRLFVLELGYAHRRDQRAQRKAKNAARRASYRVRRQNGTLPPRRRHGPVLKLVDLDFGQLMADAVETHVSTQLDLLAPWVEAEQARLGRHQEYRRQTWGSPALEPVLAVVDVLRRACIKESRAWYRLGTVYGLGGGENAPWKVWSRLAIGYMQLIERQAYGRGC